MKKILFAWLGMTDINASLDNEAAGSGPILRALRAHPYHEAVILNNMNTKGAANFYDWLQDKVQHTRIIERTFSFSDPNDFNLIYESAMSVLKEFSNEQVTRTYHLSPGTASMMATWVFISASTYPAELIQSSKEHGVNIVRLPFEISSEYRSSSKTAASQRITALLEALPPNDASFSDIIFGSDVMKECIAMARHIAPLDVSVILLGETGTGKELLAKAIHNASDRKNANFVPVNCSAIPESLFESEFFGYKKGAFTGAATDRKGHFEMASGGTLFLDEIGDMPLILQTKLLRAIESRKITPLGSTKEIEFNVRIIAATNRDLITEVGRLEFRPDLFHRLSHAVIKIPPLRERSGDISLLIENAMAKVSREHLKDKKTTMAPKAKQVLINYRWPGNVRELYNTVARAAVWSTSSKINEDDIKRHLIKIPETHRPSLNIRLGDGFNANQYLNDVRKELITKAEKESGGNISKAARLLGLENYQTYNNWKKRLSI